MQNDSVKNLCKTVNDRLESLDIFIDEANVSTHDIIRIILFSYLLI